MHEALLNLQIGEDADGYVSIGQGLIGKNMFAYINNNSINMVDPNGRMV